MWSEVELPSLLAAYDLGAPTSLLQKIYDNEAKGQSDMYQFERKQGKREAIQETFTVQNWTSFLGDERWVVTIENVHLVITHSVFLRYYPSYLDFFTEQISSHGVGEVLERHVFAPAANGNGAYMLLRFVGGA